MCQHLVLVVHPPSTHTKKPVKASPTNRCLCTLEIAIKRYEKKFREGKGFWGELS